MAIYSEAPLQALVDLINEANPNLPFALNTADYTFGMPAVITASAASVNNTKLKITAKRSSGYIGSVEVTYRRRDLALLFRGITADITVYRSGNVGTTVLLPLINEKYGINLTADDIIKNDTLWNSTVSSSYSNAQGKTKTFVANPASLIYIGSVGVTWRQAKQPLASKIPEGPAAGLTFFTRTVANPDATKPMGELVAYGFDFSGAAASLDKLSNYTTALAAGSPVIDALMLFNQVFKGDLSLADSATRGGVGGLTATKYTLPHTAVPEANADQFSKVLVITAVAKSWFTGRILIHYN